MMVIRFTRHGAKIADVLALRRLLGQIPPMINDASAVQLQILRAMSAERKLQITQQLRDAAWAMKAAGVRSAHPELSETMIQDQVRQIFLRADS